jgi:hypothetical protein
MSTPPGNGESSIASWPSPENECRRGPRSPQALDLSSRSAASSARARRTASPRPMAAAPADALSLGNSSHDSFHWFNRLGRYLRPRSSNQTFEQPLAGGKHLAAEEQGNPAAAHREREQRREPQANAEEPRHDFNTVATTENCSERMAGLRIGVSPRLPAARRRGFACAFTDWTRLHHASIPSRCRQTEPAQGASPVLLGEGLATLKTCSSAARLDR